jgi:hypothetical protein
MLLKMKINVIKEHKQLILGKKPERNVKDLSEYEISGSHGGNMPMFIFWAVTLCGLGGYQRFGRTYCLCLHG